MTDSGLAPLLVTWLPGQRWFAGSGSGVHKVDITSDLQLATGDPELRHLIVDAWIGQEKVAYQVLVGLRASLPTRLAGAAIGTTPDGRTAYDGAADPDLTAVLIDAMAGGRSLGPLRFAAAPGAVIDAAASGRTLPAVTSNTSVVFGDKAILKLLRRPFEGHHPDLEIPAALAAGGSKLVAAPLGWIEITGPEPTVLGIMSEFFPGARDGWSLARESLNADPPDFADSARQLGSATATLHAELAAAFGTSVLSRADLAAMADSMRADLASATAAIPALGAYQADIAACYMRLTEPGPPVITQRIHGDYHLAQVLRVDRGWIMLDFEGEPSVPLHRRRAFAPALRDVAGMLRSFDYAARHQARRPADTADTADTAGQRATAIWVDDCQQAFCEGYAEVSGADPRGSGPLLRALTYSKAVYEAVYEARHRPDWLPIPLAALAEASR